MRKIISLILVIGIVAVSALYIQPIFGDELTELATNNYYDAAQLFSDAVTETDGFVMTSAQKKEYEKFGKNIFGEAIIQEDGTFLLPEKSKKTSWNSSITKIFNVNLTSAGKLLY